MHLTLKTPITTAAEDKFCDIFTNFRPKKVVKGGSLKVNRSIIDRLRSLKSAILIRDLLPKGGTSEQKDFVDCMKVFF